MHFCLLGTNGVHVKAKNERFTAPGSRCRQNFKYENSRRHLVDYFKELHQKGWRAWSAIIFPHSTNQIIDLWLCPCRCRRHFLNSLLGAVTLDLLPMGNLAVTAWVGFTLGYVRLPVCGHTLVNYPRGW